MRRLWPAALLVALALVGCGDAGALAPAPVPTATSAVPTEAPSAAAPGSPSSEPTPAPTPTETAAASPQRSGPPPAIWLPDSGVSSDVLPAEGVAVAAGGVYDLYVQCRGELEIWNGAHAGQEQSWYRWIPSLGCSSEVGPPGTVHARYGLGADEAEALAIVEPDSELPRIIRVPAGQPLSGEQRSRLAEGLAGVGAFDVSMRCDVTGDSVRVGDVTRICARGQERYVFGVVPAGDPLPSPELPEGFDGMLTFRPSQG